VESSVLQEHLEEYLKREGLYAVIPEHRRPPLPIALIWLIGLWIPAIYFLLRYRGFGGLLMAIFGPAVLLAGILLILAIFFAIRQFRSGKKLADTDARTVGGVLMFGFPVLMAVVLGLYLRSWSVTVWYVVLSAVGMMFVLLLQWQAHRARLLIELARSTFRVLWQSVTLLLMLVPLLLVVVLLSVFSQELWESLGGLSLARLIVGAFLMALPAFLFVSASLEREATGIVGEFPEGERIAENAESTPFIKNKLDSGLISEEEWARLRSELRWRDKTKLSKNLLPILQNKVKRWLALLLGLTSIALITSFFAYFYILFSVLLKPSLVATWVDMQLETLVLPLSFLGYSWEVGLPTTAGPVAKVSLLLAIFVAVMSSIYAFTDDLFKMRFTKWLDQKAVSWLAVSFIYQCAMSPNYQIWEYVVNDKQKGIANVSIIIPQGLSKKEVEKACEHMETRLQEYRNLVLITAFEQNVERPVYTYGMPGNRWQLLHNKNKGIREFEPIPFVANEPRYQHFLGRDCLQNGLEISDDWFGNTPQGIAIAKAIWKADVGHEWVLHPYAFEGTILSLEINLTRRMAKSDQYRQYVRKLLTLTKQKAPDVQNIWIYLYFRDTIDILAHLNWSKQLSYVEYKDEIKGKSRIEKLDDWEGGNH